MDEIGFIGRESWRDQYTNFPHLSFIDDKDVTVNRSMLFFASGEKTKLSRIQAHFTEFAIQKLIHDEFIKIHD